MANSGQETCAVDGQPFETDLSEICVLKPPPSNVGRDDESGYRRRRLPNLVTGFFCSVAVIGVQGAWAVQVWSIPLRGYLIGKKTKFVMVGLGGGSFVGMMLRVLNIMCERDLSCWFRVVLNYCLLPISI